MLDIEWERFNALKSFIVEFVSTGNGGSPFFNQTGTQIKENKMVLQLLQLLFHLIQGGFYPAKDLVEVLPTLIQLLDGRDDKVHEIRRRGRAVSARDDPAAPPQPRAHLRPLYSLPQEVSPPAQRFHPRQPTSHHTPRYHTGGPPRRRKAFGAVPR